MRDTLWRGLYKLRSDGDGDYLSISLGRASELLDGAQPEAQAMVRVLDDGRIEIEILTEDGPTTKAQGETETEAETETDTEADNTNDSTTTDESE
jgi:hypothetical protein